MPIKCVYARIHVSKNIYMCNIKFIHIDSTDQILKNTVSKRRNSILAKSEYQ